MIAGMPNIESLSLLPEEAQSSLFVCAAGFEDRTMAIPGKLAGEGVRFRRVFMLTYEDPEDKEALAANAGRLSELHEITSLLSDEKVEPIPYALADPAANRDRISDLSETAKQTASKVKIDVSSMTSLCIVNVIRALRDKELDITLYYGEAAEYYPKLWEVRAHTPEDVDTQQGIREVIWLPEYMGEHDPSYPSILITFLGFAPIRIAGLYHRIEPQTRIGIIGMPPRHDRHWRADYSAERHGFLFNSPNSEVYWSSTLHYKEILALLEVLWSRFSRNANVIIAPLGSKLQTVAAMLHADAHRDVQLVFSAPVRYNPTRYSRGTGPLWQLQLPPLSEVIESV